MDWFTPTIEDSHAALEADVRHVLGDHSAQYMRGHFGDLLADIVQTAVDTGSPLGSRPEDAEILHTLLGADADSLPLDGDSHLGEAYWDQWNLPRTDASAK